MSAGETDTGAAEAEKGEENELRHVGEAGQPGLDADLRLLQGSWQFASIIHFCRLFAAPLRIKPFSADMLEASLLHPYSQQRFLGELFYRLLRQDASAPLDPEGGEEWETLLHDKLAVNWRDGFQANPLQELSFFEVLPATRLRILFLVCEWRVVECPVLRDFIKRAADAPDQSADILRQAPIGEDARGARYFYFSQNHEDCRMYREDPPMAIGQKKTRPSGSVAEDDGDAKWHTVATTLEEMAELAAALAPSRNKAEKALAAVLTDNILPRLEETAAARKRAEEKAARLEAMPRKRSSRIQQAAKKAEEEEARAREQAAERDRLRKERERIKKEREREERLVARQREQEALAAQLQPSRHEAGESREVRMARRQQKVALSEYGSGSEASEDSADSIRSEEAPAPAPEPAKRRHPPGWSPLGLHVHKRPRTGGTRLRTSDFQLLLAAICAAPPAPPAVAPRPPPRAPRPPPRQRPPPEPSAPPRPAPRSVQPGPQRQSPRQPPAAVHAAAPAPSPPRQRQVQPPLQRQLQAPQQAVRQPPVPAMQQPPTVGAAAPAMYSLAAAPPGAGGGGETARVKKPRKPRAKQSTENAYLRPRFNFRERGAFREDEYDFLDEELEQEEQQRRQAKEAAVQQAERRTAQLGVASQPHPAMELQRQQQMLEHQQRLQLAQAYQANQAASLQRGGMYRQGVGSAAPQYGQAAQYMPVAQAAQPRQWMAQLFAQLPPHQKLQLQQMPEAQRNQYLLALQQQLMQQQARQAQLQAASQHQLAMQSGGSGQYGASSLAGQGAGMVPQTTPQQPTAGGAVRGMLAGNSVQLQQVLSRMNADQQRQFAAMTPQQQAAWMQQYQMMAAQQQQRNHAAAAAATAASGGMGGGSSSRMVSLQAISGAGQSGDGAGRQPSATSPMLAGGGMNGMFRAGASNGTASEQGGNGPSQTAKAHAAASTMPSSLFTLGENQ